MTSKISRKAFRLSYQRLYFSSLNRLTENTKNLKSLQDLGSLIRWLLSVSL